MARTTVGRRVGQVGVVVLLAAIAVFGLTGSATATVAGSNGPIAYVEYVGCYSNPSVANYQIYKEDPDYSGYSDLSQSECSYSDTHPHFSPDGSQIAFFRCCPGGQNTPYVMNSDGTGQTALGHGSTTNDDQSLAWSPDGTQIAFTHYDNPYESIWVMNADGTGAYQVPNTSYIPNVRYPDLNDGIAWSPDGTKIAFSAYSYADGEYDIWTISPTGTGATDITTGAGADSYGVGDWSSNGLTILTSRYTCSREDIWLVNANGSGGTNLTCGGTSYNYDPAASPDGTQIVYVSNGDLRLMNSDGSGQSFFEYNAYQPSWGVPYVTSEPAQVSGLTGSYTPSTGAVGISWTNPAATSTTGKPTGDVVRRGGNDGTCPQFTSDGTAVGGTGLRTSQTDSLSGQPVGLYCYAVFATDSSGAGPGSTVFIDTGSGPAPNSPGIATYHFYSPSRLTTGTSPTVPEQTKWTASSTAGVTYQLQEQVNGGAWTTVYSGTGLSFNTQLVFGDTYDFQVRAVKGGVPSQWQQNTPFTVMAFQQTAATYTGTWTNTTNTNQWGGSGKYTKAKNASASLTFRGRTFAIIGNMGTGNSSASLYVDGAFNATLNEHASATSFRNIVGRWGWTETGTHTIKIVNSATSGHPRFDLDGVVVFQ
jgi:hypothetical protein